MEWPLTALCPCTVRRIPATLLVGVAAFLLGSASATNLSVLVNQDAVWGWVGGHWLPGGVGGVPLHNPPCLLPYVRSYALILSGCFLIFLVIWYGILRFRKKLYIEYGIGDWPLPWVWVGVVL